MNCKRALSLLPAYLDSEVTLREGERIKTHLSACPSCRRQAESLAALRSSLRQALVARAGEASPDSQTCARWMTEANRKTSPVSAGLEAVGAWFFRHGAWKAAFTAAFILTLVIGLNAIQLLAPKPAEVLAKSLVENSPAVNAAVEGEEIIEVEVVTKLVDQNGKVVSAWVLTENFSVMAELDLVNGRIINTIPVQMPEIMPGDEERVIEIAMADPVVKGMLDQGAEIRDVSLGHSLERQEITGPDGTTQTEWSASLSGSLQIWMGKNFRLVMVDLEEGRVIGISTSSTIRLNWGTILATKVAPYLIPLGILMLIGIAFKNRAAEKLAGLASILFGLVSIGGIISTPSDTVRLILLIGIPVTGLIIGIVDARRRHSGRWIPAIGIALCSLIGGFLIFTVIMGELADRRSAEIMELGGLFALVTLKGVSRNNKGYPAMIQHPGK